MVLIYGTTYLANAVLDFVCAFALFLCCPIFLEGLHNHGLVNIKFKAKGL